MRKNCASSFFWGTNLSMSVAPVHVTWSSRFSRKPRGSSPQVARNSPGPGRAALSCRFFHLWRSMLKGFGDWRPYSGRCLVWCNGDRRWYTDTMGIEWGESHDGVLQINANNIYIYTYTWFGCLGNRGFPSHGLFLVKIHENSKHKFPGNFPSRDIHPQSSPS